MNWTKLVGDDLKEDGSDAKIGSVSVEVYGMSEVEIEVLDGGTDC